MESGFLHGITILQATKVKYVSILVLMESGFLPKAKVTLDILGEMEVSILVLMESGFLQRNQIAIFNLETLFLSLF